MTRIVFAVEKKFTLMCERVYLPSGGRDNECSYCKTFASDVELKKRPFTLSLCSE